VSFAILLAIVTLPSQGSPTGIEWGDTGDESANASSSQHNGLGSTPNGVWIADIGD